MANLIAGTILGLGLIIGSISLDVFLARWDDQRPHGPEDKIAKYVLLTMIGVIPPAIGIALLYWMKRLGSHRVTVHENGFSYVYAGSTEICLWTELEKIQEMFIDEELTVLKIPGGTIKKTDRFFVLRRHDGKEFRFTINSIDSIPRLAKCLEDARDRFEIPWERSYPLR